MLSHCERVSQSDLEALEYLLAQDSPQHIPLLKKLVLEKSWLRDTVGWGIRERHETAIERLSTVAAARDISIVWR